MTIVIDNSVAMAWCFEDEHTPEVIDLLHRVVEEGGHAPQLWPLEALNGLLVAQRRGRLDASKRRALVSRLQNLPIRIDSETTDHAWSATHGLADAHGLTAYDAAYLELAMRLGLPLATTDGALITACGKTGVVLPLSDRD